MKSKFKILLIISIILNVLLLSFLLTKNKYDVNNDGVVDIVDVSLVAQASQSRMLNTIFKKKGGSDMSELYKAIAGSPITYLAGDISAAQTTIAVADDSALPDAPNICTIGYGENIETIRYGAKSNGVLQNVTRGIEGTPRAWPAGTEVARFFTAYDHNAIVETIKSHQAESAKLGIYGISASQSIPHNYTESTQIILNKVERAADLCELTEDGGIKILKSGLYLVTFICAFAHNPNGRRQIGIPGEQPIMAQPVSQTGAQTRLSITYPIYRSSGNIVRFTVLQTSGEALGVISIGTQVLIAKLG